MTFLYGNIRKASHILNADPGQSDPLAGTGSDHVRRRRNAAAFLLQTALFPVEPSSRHYRELSSLTASVNRSEKSGMAALTRTQAGSMGIPTGLRINSSVAV